ncbi:MAG: ABC transporter ATP-binding protein [Myxococcales bacterium]|nr:ABC transporter ATP-binding protein [Myxococcales bacterium]
MSAPGALLELEGVGASYGGRAAAPLVDLDLEVRPGEVVVVLGPNGAGKTTLVRVAAGLLAPSCGRVRLGGEDLARLDRRAIARRIAVLAQRCETPAGFSVRDVVAMGRAPHVGGWLHLAPADERAVDGALARCRLEPLAARPAVELSQGEQKRVHLARVLAQGAPLLVLDEAAAHLDVGHAAMLYALVRSAVGAAADAPEGAPEATPRACLAVVHDLDAARRHADRVVLLKEGRVLAHGPVAEVMTPELLGKAFDARIVMGEPGYVASGER